MSKKILIADDRLAADEFLGQVSQGTSYLWRGDFQNAKQLLQAAARRIDKKSQDRLISNLPLPERFHAHRQVQAHRARLLAGLLIEVDSTHKISLPRAPDVAEAIRQAGINENPGPIPLRDLLGMIGAYEWRKKGVEVSYLEGRIHPYYGLFSPVRGEYLELVAQAVIPAETKTAFDIGTGTGVIAAILAKRKIPKTIATDLDPVAVACAKENLERLGYSSQVEVKEADLFPTGTADLIVCNPPWLPARPTSTLERAIYDEDSRMLKGFLSGLKNHLNKSAEAWLIISDLAERLGLRTTNELDGLISKAGLKVRGIQTTTPRHRKAHDPSDPLYKARSKRS